MARGKKHTPEQVVNLLRQIEVAVANGKTTPVACRENGITAIAGGCPLMYSPTSDFGHVCIRWVMGLTGGLPKDVP